jgi:transcriptional regulator with XRE-family HTH domain
MTTPDLLTAALDRIRLRRQLPDGNTARALREEAGLTQTEFGAVVGVSGVAISLWERNLRRPRDPRLVENYLTVLDRLARELAQSGRATRGRTRRPREARGA